MSEKAVRNRVIQQEFVYWLASTAWNLQEPYRPKYEKEWQVKDRSDLRAKLTDFFRSTRNQSIGIWWRRVRPLWQA